MIADKGIMVDGITTLVGGMDSGRSPSTVGQQQCSYASNVTFRGGFAKSRPVFKRIKFTGSDASTFLAAKFQGAIWFTETDDDGYIIAVAGGNIYQIEPPRSSAGWIVNDITNSAPLDADAERVWMIQAKENLAKNYLIIQDGVHRPYIFAPTTGGRYSVEADKEVPVGTGPMAYGHGRLWVAQGSNFVAGDIANGENGVLKFSENEYVTGGGAFRVPLGSGDITAMQFTHAPNTALGEGELIVFTSDGACSVTVPANRYDWFASTDPAQKVVLINNGAMSQFSTDLANGDVLFRAKDGIRSLVQAVRDFSQFGNTPISREVSAILRNDDPHYLRYTSGVLFDNRYLLTNNSYRDAAKGVAFKGLVVMDFDLISSMTQKSPAAYDGYWQLDVTRSGSTVNIRWAHLFTGMYKHAERCFCFGRAGDDGATELWELMPSNSPELFDEDYDTSGGGTDGDPIFNKSTSTIETASYNFGSGGAAKTLESADLWIDEVLGVVTFDIDFRPDQYPVWIDWQDFSVEAKYQDCGTEVAGSSCVGEYLPQTYLPQYRPRLRVGAPPATVEGSTGTPYSYGWEFAAKIKWTGKARIKMFRLKTRETQEEPYADVDGIDSTAKTIAVVCDGEITKTAIGV